MGISVHPKDLRVTAPTGTDLDAILARVAKRAPWILDQQADLARYWPPVLSRTYVPGETHWYLGHKLRLKIYESPKDIVNWSLANLAPNVTKEP
jgi:predicted metal-dependent hydrolase